MNTRGWMLAAATLAIGLAATDAQADPPAIGQIHNPAEAGWTSLIAGAGFDSPDIVFVYWAPEPQAKDEAGIWAAVGKRPPIPDTPPETAVYQLPVLRKDAQYAAVLFPTYIPGFSGPYNGACFGVVYAGDGKTWSKPFVVNRPEAWFTDRAAVRPGATVRLWGRQLRGHMHVRGKWVALRHVATGQVRRPVVLTSENVTGEVAVEKYYLDFVVPAEASAGAYEVYVHNSSGGPWGWSDPLPLEVTTDSPKPRVAILARDFGACGDGITDDTAALQKALDAAGQQAPADVLLDIGSYVVRRMLRIPNGVNLRGRGMDLTRLCNSPELGFEGETEPIPYLGHVCWQPTWQKFYVMLYGKSDIGLYDLTVEGIGEDVGMLLVVLNIDEPVPARARMKERTAEMVDFLTRLGTPEHASHNLVLRNCRFRNEGVAREWNGLNYWEEKGLLASKFWRGIVTGRLKHARIQGCEGASPWTLFMDGCTVTHNRGGGIGLGAWNTVLAWNDFSGRSRGWCAGAHGPMGYRHVIIASNRVEGTLFYSSTDGEAYMFEGGGPQWYGSVQTPAPDRVVCPGAHWPDHYLRGHVYVVVAGRGSGQYRMIRDNTADTLVLEEPLGVLADDTTRGQVAKGTVECVLVHNRCKDNKSGIHLYDACAMGCIIDSHFGDHSVGAGIQSVDATESHKDPYMAPDYFTQIVNCLFTGGGGIYSHFSNVPNEKRESRGICQLGTIIRGNALVDTKYGIELTGDWGSTYRDCQVGHLIHWPIIEGNRLSGSAEPAWPIKYAAMRTAKADPRVVYRPSIKVSPWITQAIIRWNESSLPAAEQVVDQGKDTLIQVHRGEQFPHAVPYRPKKR